MVRTTILIVFGQFNSDQWDDMNFDGRIMSQQASGGGVAAKFGRAKSHEFRCQVIFSKASFHLLEDSREEREILNRDS